MEFRRVLCVCAHPDDEALGCGGTLARLAAEGAEVHLLFMADGVNARSGAPASALEKRRAMALQAAEVLGARAPTFLDFPDNRMDGVELLDVVSEIERCAASLAPDVVFTHFTGDLNVDHRICAQAVLTAFRPLPGGAVRAIYGFEVPSSTEWAFGAAGSSFSPHAFFDISDHLAVKLAALDAYAKEMRPFPHPRSREAVEALARWRGATMGVAAAEAFSLLRSIR